MKTVIIQSKDKWIGFADIKSSIILMYVILAMFIIFALINAIIGNWYNTLTNILFALWDFLVIAWMKKHKATYDFFKEKCDELTITRITDDNQ